MSRQNKVNPGMYTQRGRLTQDDAARELKRQRELGSQKTWQPVQKDQMPRPPVGLGDADADRDEDTSGDNQVKAKATAAKRQTSKAKKAAAKPSAPAPKRKAVLARSVGGGTTKSRPAAKRRKS